MFKNLMDFWKGKDFLTRVYGDFKVMLIDSHGMFELVCKKLINNEIVTSLEGKVYEADEKINKLEKDIRTQVVEHLTLQPTVDVSACLLLMSVVKDAERLGDYCKNLLEVAQLLEKPMDKEKYETFFNGMDSEISELFKKTQQAFVESDEEKATSAWKYESKIVKRCDKIVEELAKSNLAINEAVCFTLIARYFKRLAAHLTNIATSVVLPINELDYFDERRKEDDNN